MRYPSGRGGISAFVVAHFSSQGVLNAQPAAIAPVPAEPAAPAPEPDRRETEGAPAKLAKFAVTLRAAAVLQGSGNLETSCDGDCASVPTSSLDFTHHVALGAASVDFMGTVGRTVRLGLGFLYVAPYEVDLDGVDGSYEIGSDLSADVVCELTPRLAPGAWLVPRIQTGLTLLFPAGDLADDLDQLAGLCDMTESTDCEKIEGIKPGLNLGLGFGGLFAVSKAVALRADLLFQAYAINIFTLEPDSPNATISRSIGGNRFVVLAGVEL